MKPSRGGNENTDLRPLETAFQVVLKQSRVRIDLLTGAAHEATVDVLFL